jgi:phosphoribosyl 1,2-cyclic phosphodiesterase
MRFSVIASGSGGNACYVETDHSRVMIDAGLSCRELLRRLDHIGVDGSRLDALFITHEHTDHIRGAGPLARRFDIPLYATASTLKKAAKILGNLSTPVVIQTGQTLTINDLFIETFTKCHDAADPIGVVMAYNGTRLGLLTDVGRPTALVMDRLRGCHGLIIEFNHDEQMLEEGSYPLELKRRIRGTDGHLSNHQAGEVLEGLLHDELKLVVLAHMSDSNNHPLKAVERVNHTLEKNGRKGIKVLVSCQDHPLPMEEL